MHSGDPVFAQLMDHLPPHTFRHCVAKYPSWYPALSFSHLDQFLCMAFAQLTFRESLRANSAKLYHYRLRTGFEHYRPVSAHVSVGAIPQIQSGGQTSDASRSSRQYPQLHPHLARQTARHARAPFRHRNPQVVSDDRVHRPDDAQTCFCTRRVFDYLRMTKNSAPGPRAT